MARFTALASSSEGNCLYVGNTEYGILIDAGISCKQICLRLNDLGIDDNAVKAVFVTHEHDDHVKGLKVFADRHGVPVYATGGTFSALTKKDKLPLKAEHIILPRCSDAVNIGDIAVENFPTSHDANESCGYFISVAGSCVVIATDTGYITELARDYLYRADLVFVESNYDEDMLINGPYDAGLKRRIKSDEGHLSNDDCAAAVLDIIKNGRARNFILGHVSPHNNTPDTAFAAVDSLLIRSGFDPGSDYRLSVAPADGIKKIVRF